MLLKKLKIYTDEPDDISDHFGSKIFSEKITDFILDPDLPTPYVIGLDGEWGSGKTSLLKKTYNMINDAKRPTHHAIWFDSWKYEKYDPVLSLYQHIILKLEEINGSIKKDFKKILLNTGLIASDILSRKYLGISLDEIQEKYSNTISDVKTIHEKLDDSIGKDNRLVIFIDDLDRCENENILAILSNIKEILNSKNIIFILGIDMAKIAIAWDIKHRGHNIAKLEGKEHVDKLFQLKLKIPIKSQDALMKYVDDLVNELPEKEKTLIAISVKENPRKIKLVLNTLYFLAKQLKIAESQPTDLPYLLTITLLSVIHNDLFQIIKQFPSALFDAMFVCLLCLDHKELRDKIQNFNKILSDSTSVDIHGGRITRINISKGGLDILNIIERDEKDFNFILNIADYLEFPKIKEKEKWDKEAIERFSKLIRDTPFLS